MGEFQKDLDKDEAPESTQKGSASQTMERHTLSETVIISDTDVKEYRLVVQQSQQEIHKQKVVILIQTRTKKLQFCFEQQPSSLRLD